jgi:hypothetical protein
MLLTAAAIMGAGFSQADVDTKIAQAREEAKVELEKAQARFKQDLEAAQRQAAADLEAKEKQLKEDYASFKQQEEEKTKAMHDQHTRDLQKLMASLEEMRRNTAGMSFESVLSYLRSIDRVLPPPEYRTNAFRVLVLGDVSSGKSELCNALHGIEDKCETGLGTTTDAVSDTGLLPKRAKTDYNIRLLDCPGRDEKHSYVDGSVPTAIVQSHVLLVVYRGSLESSLDILKLAEAYKLPVICVRTMVDMAKKEVELDTLLDNDCIYLDRHFPDWEVPVMGVSSAQQMTPADCFLDYSVRNHWEESLQARWTGFENLLHRTVGKLMDEYSERTGKTRDSDYVFCDAEKDCQ